jgi:hypothetical protein
MVVAVVTDELESSARVSVRSRDRKVGVSVVAVAVTGY